MADANLKTRENDASVEQFIESVEDEQKREDSKKLVQIFKKATKQEPKMWGGSIIGFGKFRYSNSAGKEAEWLAAGFSPRKQTITVYLMDGIKKYESELKGLGKYTTAKSCLYFKRLSDVDDKLLSEAIKKSYKNVVENFDPVY